jgi:glycosyltransferase involved in cell wall biosynthesis
MHVLTGFGEDYTGRLPNVLDPVILSDSRISKPAARNVLGLSTSVSLVLIIGAIDDRKNIPLVVEACRLLRQRRPIGLAIVGQPIPAMREGLMDLAMNNSWITLDTEYVDNIAFQHWLRAADVVAAIYGNEVGPSGVGLQAIANGTQVVAAGNEHACALVRATGCGRVATALQPQAVARALQDALASPAADRPRIEAAAPDFANPLVTAAIGRKP